MTKLETFKPKTGDKLIFLGNEKHPCEYMTLGHIYRIFSYNDDMHYYYDDNGNKQFFEVLIKNYWEEIK